MSMTKSWFHYLVFFFKVKNNADCGIGKDNSRPKLCQAFGHCPQWFIFFNFFYQMQCEYPMNIGFAQVRGALLWWFFFQTFEKFGKVHLFKYINKGVLWILCLCKFRRLFNNDLFNELRCYRKIMLVKFTNFKMDLFLKDVTSKVLFCTFFTFL